MARKYSEVCQEPLRQKERTTYIFDRLDKPSKNELLFNLGDVSKAQTSLVIDILEKLHCRALAFLQLQQKFFTTNQRRDESVDDYANTLMELMLKF